MCIYILSELVEFIIVHLHAHGASRCPCFWRILSHQCSYIFGPLADLNNMSLLWTSLNGGSSFSFIGEGKENVMSSFTCICLFVITWTGYAPLGILFEIGFRDCLSLCFHCLSDVFLPSRFISARFGYSFADSLNVTDCPIHNILSIIHILSIITLYKHYYNYIHKNIDFIHSAQKCFTSFYMKYQVIEHTFPLIRSC